MKSKKEIERTLKENKGADFVLPMTWDVMFEQMFISKEAMPLLECIISIFGNVDIKDVTSKQILNFDEDEHYNTISAFIKSVRGSDTNAAIYYLARMLESGEDPRYIARRLCILASEDIGLAEPEAINIASSLINIIEFIGMPEGRIPLAEVTIYLSLCPKSNSAYKAIDSAIRDIRNGELYSIPNYLKDNNSASFDKKSEEEYKYPHNFPYHIVKQNYLEKGIKKNYYNPVDIGEERELKKVYEWIMKHID